ncbi:addiction module toxin, HicA family [Dyadobacter frigoris]|uniref:Addiction module toxin, HicA family n=1 Tax=Dyadobacter frigoris TaxID=2576211 RepID=A0A4U6D9X3_9BACT|nr:addiction module toxin, HicA family [Dyadobacter frigoris]
MKRNKLIQHLNKHSCYLRRHGAKHDIYINEAKGITTCVP